MHALTDFPMTDSPPLRALRSEVSCEIQYRAPGTPLVVWSL